MPIRRVETGWRTGRSRIVHATVEDAARFARRRQARILAHDIALRPRRNDARKAPPQRVQRFSPRLERMYAELLQSRWKLVFDLVMKYAAPAIREQAAQIEELKAGHRADSARLDASTLSVYDVIQIVRGIVGGIVEADAPGIRLIGSEIDEDATDSADRAVSRLFTIPLSSQVPSDNVREWVLANVDLSHALIDHGLDALERTADEVIRAIAEGKPTLDLAHEYQERYGYTWRKASFLARDQTANLASRIAQERMTSLGVEEYQWSTSGDSRVRQEHADLDGRIFRFDDPPVASKDGRRGNPGEVYQCRCIASPVLRSGAEERANLIAEAEARQERELFWMQASPTVQGEIENRSSFGPWNAKRLADIKAGLPESVGLPM